MELRIAAISDLHGELPKIPEADLLLLPGDIAGGGVGSEESQQRWLLGEFADWLDKNPVQMTVATPGNHDVFLAAEGKNLNLPWIYLEDEGIEIGGISIYGFPWVPPFYGVFGASEKDLAKKLESIPENTDILVSHGPPYGVNDSFSDHSGIVRTGSRVFRKKIQTSNYGLVAHGHIHECYGRGRLRNKYDQDTLIACVSYADNQNRAQEFLFDTDTGVVTGLPWR